MLFRGQEKNNFPLDYLEFKADDRYFQDFFA